MIGYGVKTKGIPVLSLDECYAKTIYGTNGIQLACTVYDHCRIVGRVAEAIAERMPAWFRNNLLPSHVGLYSALHDIGKVEPFFQGKLRKATGADMHGLPCDSDELDRQHGKHYSVTYGWLKSFTGREDLAFTLGRHHGKLPHRLGREGLGGEGWIKKQTEIVNELEKEFGAKIEDILVRDWDVASGIVTIADWIGSDEQFCISAINDVDVVKRVVAEVVTKLHVFPEPIRNNLCFQDVFGFEPYKTQNYVYSAIKPGGVYILESPMGTGKTETALYAAYKILKMGAATGIYYALPTRITADQIYGRVEMYVKKICTNDVSVKLIRGGFIETMTHEDSSPGGSWYSSAKRAILAPIGVGTIDQSLMGIIRVRHNYLRNYGLAGKVVIFDEVHSYDAYTGTLLEELVRRLQALSCTVILLSATLYSGIRDKFIDCKEMKAKRYYPMLTSKDDGGISFLKLPVSEETKVEVKYAEDDFAIDEAIKHSLEGEQVLWVENSIKEAQETFCTLASRLEGEDVEVGLIHSQFTKTDRNSLESRWIGFLGKNGDRHIGRILIGTQILEQSLDIDADFLVSRFCPTDLLLQRSGRLWRHPSNHRPEGARRLMLIIPCVKSNGDGFDFFGDSRFVYSPYVLARSFQTLMGINQILIPSSLTPLVEDSYAEREEGEGQMAELKFAFEAERDRLRSMALAGSSDIRGIDDDNEGVTRYSEIPTGTLVLVQSFRISAKEFEFLFLDGTVFRCGISPTSMERREGARLIERNSISVPLRDIKQAGMPEVLKYFMYTGSSQEEVLCSMAEVDDLGIVRYANGSTEIGVYTNKLGFRKWREKKQ